MDELKAQFINNGMKTLLREQIEHDLARLEQGAQAFVRQLADVTRIDVLDQLGQFRFFRHLLNYDGWRIDGHPNPSKVLDRQVVNSDIRSERDHLRVGDHIVRILTMKEAMSETRPLALDAFLKIPANFCAVSEWMPLPAAAARKEVNKRRRHFNISKTGFVSQLSNDPARTNPRDVLVDESKQADIENLGDCLRALGDGQQLGEFSLTIVLYEKDRHALDRLVGEFSGVFTNADGSLFVETYNQLNAYFAIVPGGYAFNLRRLYLLNSNYADLSFLFTILPGEKTNPYLGTEYLAVLETDNDTPYYPQPALRRNRAHAHPWANRLGQDFFQRLHGPECTEIPATDLHFRHWRQLRVCYGDLRRNLPQRRTRVARFHDQSVRAGADTGESSIPVQLLPGTDRGPGSTLPDRLQRKRSETMERHRAHVHAQNPASALCPISPVSSAN